MPTRTSDRPCGQPVKRLAGGRQRAGRGREGDEERIALRVDLDALIGRERRTQDAAMLGERPGVVLGAELEQQLRRALDIREEKRHRPGRKLVLHPSILSRLEPGHHSATELGRRRVAPGSERPGQLRSTREGDEEPAGERVACTERVVPLDRLHRRVYDAFAPRQPAPRRCRA